jgi:hypothetical protein
MQHVLASQSAAAVAAHDAGDCIAPLVSMPGPHSLLAVSMGQHITRGAPQHDMLG